MTLGVRQHGRILGAENFVERNCGSVAEKGMSGARERVKRGAERLCKVNGRILGYKELVSGAGQSVREGRGKTYCFKNCVSKEAGKPKTEGS
jgi:hypothetical protein